MERLHNWAIGTAAVTVAFAVAALAATQWKAWLALGLLVAGFVATVILLVLTRLSRPRLVFHDPTTETRSIHVIESFSGMSMGASATYTSDDARRVETSPTTHLEAGDVWAFFTYVWIENKPKVGAIEAKDLHSVIRFFSEKGERLREMHGRWSWLPQPATSEKLLEGPERNLPANRRRMPIDVALKYHEDDDLHAFNDETGHRAKDLRAWPLGPGPVTVEVEVLGSNAHGIGRYVLSCSNDGTPELTAKTTQSRRPHPLRRLGSILHSIGRKLRPQTSGQS